MDALALGNVQPELKKSQRFIQPPNRFYMYNIMCQILNLDIDLEFRIRVNCETNQNLANLPSTKLIH